MRKRRKILGNIYYISRADLPHKISILTWTRSTVSTLFLFFSNSLASLWAKICLESTIKMLEQCPLTLLLILNKYSSIYYLFVFWIRYRFINEVHFVKCNNISHPDRKWFILHAKIERQPHKMCLNILLGWRLQD